MAPISVHHCAPAQNPFSFLISFFISSFCHPTILGLKQLTAIPPLVALKALWQQCSSLSGRGKMMQDAIGGVG